VPIREIAVDGSGKAYRLADVAPRECSGRFDVGALRPGEWIVRPDLVYAVLEQASPAGTMKPAA
jgi:hypothetical protein